MGRLFGDGMPHGQLVERVLDEGIALWDVLANVHGDRADEVPDELLAWLLDQPSISSLCFNGASAYRIFVRHHRAHIVSGMLVLANSRKLVLRTLPSSSRAAAVRLDDKATAWHAALLRPSEAAGLS